MFTLSHYKMIEYKIMNGNHSVYNLQYHIVLVVKYRRKCINYEVGTFLISEATRVLEVHGCALVEGNYDRDHIHLLISTTPTTEPAKLIGILKKVLSYGVRKNYKNYLVDYLGVILFGQIVTIFLLQEEQTLKQ